IGVHSLASAPSPAAAVTATTTSGPAEEPTAPLAGGELTVDGHRYAIGTADDRVLVADWACDGSDTAVVVRPSGAVFRFERWADPGDELTAVPAGQWPDPATVGIGRD